MKKFLIILLVLFISGCNGGSSDLQSSRSEILTSNTGTATIKGVDELEAYTALFGEIPSEIAAKYKKEEDITVPITRSVVYIDTENNLLTGVVIISNDKIFQPIVYNNVPLTKQGDDWITPDGTKVNNTTISGSYFNLTMTSRTHDTSINLEEVLYGTWTLDGSQCGGVSGDITILPEIVSMSFNTDNTVDMFFSLRNDRSALYQDFYSTEGSLTKIDNDVYKFIEKDGTESLILVENIDEILMFRSNVFLPLKKVSFTPAKSWVATSGGGYVKLNMSDYNVDETIRNALETISFTLKSGRITFSEDNVATFDYSFAVHNEIFELLGINDMTDSSTVTFTPSGNFLKYISDTEVDQFVFISEKEAFFATSSANDDEIGEGKFIIKFKAEE